MAFWSGMEVFVCFGFGFFVKVWKRECKQQGHKSKSHSLTYGFFQILESTDNSFNLKVSPWKIWSSCRKQAKNFVLQLVLVT